MIFDSHAHINYDGYSEAEREELIRNIEGSGVSYVLDVGFDVASSRVAAAHAERLPWCYAAVGLHPHDAAGATDETVAEIRGLAARSGVVAVGEIGLDYYRDLSPRDAQQTMFRKQLDIARELGMPVTIHDRDSGGDTLRILKEEGFFDAERVAAFPPNPETGIPDARVLLHCFSGTADEALAAIELGATISIAGPVTYKKNDKTREVAARIPLAHMLIETDAPYLSPEPFRGKPNSSPFIVFTARKIAEVRGVSEEEIENATCENALRFFGIRD
ncbi:MAG: TatD family hydrolase [Clostridiales Family XIII bacterium]|jgi:TatD DNase family protein|nr:TatD family hydrolase [Clostridiales Family XIII bacterium]